MDMFTNLLHNFYNREVDPEPEKFIAPGGFTLDGWWILSDRRTNLAWYAHA